MDLHGFVEEQKPAWRRLEILLEKAERTRFRLTPAEARELCALYRRASADLCRAQARTANAEILRYLNDLVARAYGQIYSGRRFRISEVAAFLSRGFPALVRARWRAVALSAALLLLGTIFGFVAAWFDEDARHFLLPEAFRSVAEHIEATPQRVGSQTLPVGMSALMSSAIMTNNIRVSFMAFAFGITAGVGTCAVLFTNGLMLGVLAAYFHRAGPGYALDFWALILPHGVIELAAIVLAGAAGLLLGAAILAPGDMTRRQALRRRGAEAGRIAMGTVPMLVLAGLIEGFVTPQSFLPPAGKLGFAAATAVGLAVYFAPREWAAEAHPRALSASGASRPTSPSSGRSGSPHSRASPIPRRSRRRSSGGNASIFSRVSFISRSTS